VASPLDGAGFVDDGCHDDRCHDDRCAHR